MTHLPIKDIEKGTEITAQIYAVRDFEVKAGANGNFAKCVLFDATGEVTGMWFNPPDDPGEYLTAKFLDLGGTGDEFKGSKQIKISGASAVDPGPAFDYSPYIKASVFSRRALEKFVTELVVTIEGEPGQVVAEILFEGDTFDLFLDAPAALKNHHAYKRGLAEHVVSMCGLARRAAEHYNTMYAAHTDADVVDLHMLLAGVVLHDLAKVWDFEPDGLAYKYNVHSTLVGHIPEVDARIRAVCRRSKISIETEQKLRHLVLSHHGRKDFGSPVEPATIEALILHQIDMIDSRVNMMRCATEDLEPGEASDRVWALGTRVIR